jgi:putative salt-induced outer membrane protein YdiY
MRKRRFSTLLLALVLALPAAAQDTPDDVASERPCLNGAHFGFNATRGNADTLSLLLGSDLCRQWQGGRWSADLDATVHQTDGQSAAERVDLYLFRERHYRKDWVISFLGSGEVDRARGLRSRVLAGAGVGKLHRFTWRKGIHAGLHGGLAYTVTDERAGDEHGFPEAWSKLEVSAGLNDQLMLTSALHAFSNLTDTNDFRVNAETNVVFQVTSRISLRTGLTVMYDERPARGADEFDLATHTLLAFSWGKTGAK